MRIFIVLLIWLFPYSAWALNLTSDDCLEATIEADIATIMAAGGGTLTLPVCDQYNAGTITFDNNHADSDENWK